MTTLKDVARAAGVSTATVSNVLNGRKRFSPAVEERVWTAARGLGYFPNDSARTLRTGHSHTLGLIIPDLQNPFFPVLVRSIEHRARQLGYTLLLVDIDNEEGTEREGFRVLAEKGVDGIIWAPHRLTEPPATTCPVVCVDRPVQGIDSVSAHHERGGELLGEYVGRSGHRSIGLLSGPQHLNSARQRREGLLRALPPQVQIVWEEQVPFDLQLPEPALHSLQGGEASLVVAANDVVAVAAVEALTAAGVEVPAQVSVVGFDDIPWASLIWPRLSTVRQPIAQLGRAAVEVLLRRIGEPAAPLIEQVLGVELVERGSVMKKPALEVAS